MLKNTKRSRFFLIFLLGLLSAIGPFTIDMYLPAFNFIAEDIGTTIDKVQLTLTSYFIGVAIGQLFYGPILDRYGRKTPLLVGLGIYVLSSLLCSFATSIESLILYRFLQALGGASGMVAARAMVRDFFKPYETAQIMSLLMLVIGASPILAPTIGSVMVSLGDWHYIFLVLTGLGLGIWLMVYFFLKGAKGPDTSISLKPRTTYQQFAQVFRLRQFLLFSLAGGFAASGMYAYLSGSPFVLMELYSLSESQYGWAFALLAGGLIIASQLNSIALRFTDSLTIARWASLLQLLVGSALISMAFFDYHNIFVLLGLLFTYLFCQGFVFPNTSALSLNPFKRLAGSASAAMGFLQLSIGAISSMLVSVLHNATQAPMAGIMGMMAFLSMFILWVYRPKELLEDIL